MFEEFSKYVSEAGSDSGIIKFKMAEKEIEIFLMRYLVDKDEYAKATKLYKGDIVNLLDKIWKMPLPFDEYKIVEINNKEDLERELDKAVDTVFGVFNLSNLPLAMDAAKIFKETVTKTTNEEGTFSKTLSKRLGKCIEFTYAESQKMFKIKNIEMLLFTLDNLTLSEIDKYEIAIFLNSKISFFVLCVFLKKYPLNEEYWARLKKRLF